MKKITFTFLLVGSLFYMSSCNDQPKEEKAETVDIAEDKNDSILEAQNAADGAKRDADFIVTAANTDLKEIEAARLAQKLGVSKDVKSYAQHMIEDHTKSSTEIKALAGKLNIVLPDSLDGDEKSMVMGLKDKKGKEFDDAYMDMMVSDHKKTLENFKDISEDTKNSEVKALADKMIPTLQMHYDMASKTDSLLDARNKK